MNVRTTPSGTPVGRCIARASDPEYPCSHLRESGMPMRRLAHAPGLIAAIHLIGLLASVTPSALAQTQTQLPTVVVSGSRFDENSNQVPANVRVLTREQIDASAASNIPEALAYLGGLVVSGFNLGPLGLGASIDLGGFGATANSTTLILLDGQRLNPSDSLGVAWESIPLERVERIEILHGGASVQYGNGAVGGVVNIITRSHTPSGTEVSASVGSNGTVLSSARLTRTTDHRSLQLNANTAATDGWRENSAANAYAFNARLTDTGSGLDRHWVDLSASHSRAQSPGGVVGQVGNSDGRAAKFNNIGAQTSGDNASVRGGLVRALSESLLFEGEAGYSQRSVAYHAPYFASADSVAGGYPGGPDRTRIDSWETTFTPRVKAEWGQGIHSVLGYDFSRSQEKYGDSYGPLAEQSILDNQGFGYYNNLLVDTQRASVTSHSLYMITRAPLGESLEASGGLRRQVESVQAQDANISAPNGPISQTRAFNANAYDLALNRQYGRGQRAYVKWSQSFRFANLDEFWGFDPNTYERVFSGILKPQISRAWEVGSTWRPGATRIDLSAFESRTQDEIRYDPNTYYNTNSPDGILRRGVFFDLTTPLGSRWEASAGGRLQRSTYSSGDAIGQTIALVPDTVLRAGLTWRSSANWSGGVFARHVGRQHYDGDRDNTLARVPSATTADLFARYTEGRWEIRMTLKNATGQRYATYAGHGYVLQPGGTGASNYYYYPGDPRTVLLTARVRF